LRFRLFDGVVVAGFCLFEFAELVLYLVRFLRLGSGYVFEGPGVVGRLFPSAP